MVWIEKLKRNDVTFNIVSEERATEILQKEYPYYKLMEYANVFEKYRTGDKQGKFVKLDFGHLYYLAKIDEELSHIIMRQCLEIEQKLKAKLIYDIYCTENKDEVLKNFLNNDMEFLSENYTVDRFNVIKEKYNVESIQYLNIESFIDVVQFGTFERLLKFFYKTNSDYIMAYKYISLDSMLPSLRYIRNLVAHNNSVLSQLTQKNEKKNTSVASYLRRGGINKKTLETNLTKKVLSDFCIIQQLYCSLQSEDKIKDNIIQMEIFFKKYCETYLQHFEQNFMLVSAYNFIIKILDIYNKPLPKRK